MKFRTRLLLAFAGVAVGPLIALLFGVRYEFGERLESQYRDRLDRLTSQIDADLESQATILGQRLRGLAADVGSDNQFRLALQGSGDRRYLLDYAQKAMSGAGLSMLWIQDSAGRILSSGHYRNEFDRTVRLSPSADVRFLTIRLPEGNRIVYARRESVRVGAESLLLVAGVDGPAILAHYATPDSQATIRLLLPGDSLPYEGDAVSRVIVQPYEDATADGADSGVRIMVSQSLGPLAVVRRNVDRWFVVAGIITLAAALALAFWLSSRVSTPLEVLAEKTARLDLERLDVSFVGEGQGEGEVAELARTLQQMTDRLRASTATLREAERRATVGDLARQLNHDIKNGLVPVRNVFRHLSQVAKENPAQLPAILLERQGTIEAGITYLENLARNYARLTPALDTQPSDLNAIISEVVPPLGTGAELQLDLAPGLPSVAADPLVLRRILENLVSNAVESLDDAGGQVTVITRAAGNGNASSSVVRLTVADQGRGMTEQELERAFQDFYTTKAGGTGLGLSIVRRLVLDLNGSMRVETAPKSGTRFIVDLPAAGAPTYPPTRL